jgi:uncharacterized protein (TIGR00730 family)
MESVCVYLGANSGSHAQYKEETTKLAYHLVKMNLTLVYGGSSLGMMGLLATIVKELGGKVIGVITTHLIEKEKPLNILDALHIVDSIQERKKMLQHLGDAFAVLPGGLGTLEEAFETWNAIKTGELDKKIGFLNVNHFFDGLFDFIKTCNEKGFINEAQAAIPAIHSEPEILLKYLTCKV